MVWMGNCEEVDFKEAFCMENWIKFIELNSNDQNGSHSPSNMNVIWERSQSKKNSLKNLRNF